VADIEIENLKRQLKKKGYSDIAIEEILRWYFDKKKQPKPEK